MRYRIIILLLVIFALSACHKDNPVIPSGDTEILSLNSDSLAYGDTLIIKGKFFGSSMPGKRLIFDSLVSVNSNECLLWHNSEIHLVIPNGTRSGMAYLYFDTLAIDSTYIGISKVPFFDVVEVKAGKFTRGSNVSSLNEMPAREIAISSDFYISKYEVNQRVYQAVTGSNPSNVKDIRLPVDSISWLAAVEFCNKLSAMHNLESVYTVTGIDVTMDTAKTGWRLPTEAEWEYACRAGTQGDFAGSGILNEMAWYSENSGMKMHPGGRKKANDFGIYDMHGNVWEWCWDFYGGQYYSTSPDVNPLGPATGNSRVMRGGSWSDGMNFARSSNRSLPLQIGSNTGIRIIRKK
ncbi:MAG: formylglycine-generating enzyme family protein [Candidatus Kapabacteria bacterium]|nr:formylglycine-generating enzyme family protein [Ignavibacteriota bacterium]MCW5884010.1 formylglycine-generating enzyme family protein [Candidatus Kapabacteria bacterium]